MQRKFLSLATVMTLWITLGVSLPAKAELTDLWRGRWAINGPFYTGDILIYFHQTGEFLAGQMDLYRKSNPNQLYYRCNNVSIYSTYQDIRSDRLTVVAHCEKNLGSYGFQGGYTFYMFLVREPFPKGVGNKGVGYYYMTTNPNSFIQYDWSKLGHINPITINKIPE